MPLTKGLGFGWMVFKYQRFSFCFGNYLQTKTFWFRLPERVHDYLGFDGKILLSTVMPDELIDRLETKDYFRLIGDLRPDATMIPDNYTYTDAPLHQSWSQTIRLVSFANEFLKLDIPLIGLVKGANLRQMDWAVRKQVEMGYASFAMPARELFEEERLDEFLPYVLISLKRSYRVKKISSSFSTASARSFGIIKTLVIAASPGS